MNAPKRTQSQINRSTLANAAAVGVFDRCNSPVDDDTLDPYREARKVWKTIWNG